MFLQVAGPFVFLLACQHLHPHFQHQHLLGISSIQLILVLQNPMQKQKKQSIRELTVHNSVILIKQKLSKKSIILHHLLRARVCTFMELPLISTPASQ